MVTDFGLAKRVEGDSKVTQTGSIVGTPSYMAPEQAAGKKDVTTAVDVYSLGAILYEMLTGRPPFRGANPLDTLLDVLDREPAAPRSLNPAVDRDLATITLKCLDKDPARRYGSAEALAEDLERWLAGVPILARPASSLERAAKWARRRPAIAALVAAVVLVSVLGVAGIALQWQHAVAAEGKARAAEGVALSRAQTEARARADEEKAKNQARAAQQKEAFARKQEEAARKKEEEHRKKAESERDAKQRALVRADGLRLNAEAAAARHSDPALAMLLALEAVQRTPHRLTFATLHDALHDCRELRTLYGTGAPLRYTPDGTLLVSANSSWDPSGKQVARAPEWRTPIDWLDLSPDGRRAVSLITGHQDVFYEDGKEPSKYVFTDRVAYIWDTRTGKDLLHLRRHRDHIASARFSPDGKQVVTSSWDNTAILWDAVSGKKLHEFVGHQCGLHTALFSPDGGRVLTVTSGRMVSGNAAMWKAMEEKNPNAPAVRERDPGVIDRKGRSGGSGSIFFHLNVFGENPVARLFDARTGKQLAALVKGGESGGFKFDLAKSWTVFSPTWLTALDAQTGNHLGKWLEPRLPSITLPAFITSRVPLLRGHPGNSTAAAFSPDGKLVAIAFEQGVACLWDVSKGGWPRLEQREHTGAIRALAFSPEGTRLATAGDDRSVRILNLPLGKTALVLWGHEAAVRLVRFSPDGKFVLSGSADGTVRLWDVATGEQKAVLRGHGKEITSAEFRPDGQRILTTGADGTARLWDVHPPREIAHVLRGHTGKINSLAFSPDGTRLLTAAGDDTPRLWDPATGREVLRLGTGMELGPIRSARFSTDGKKIVTASQNTYIVKGTMVNPSAVHVWDAKTGRDLLALADHRHAALDADFSADGQVILTISDGNTHARLDQNALKGNFALTSSGAAGLARLWDARSGKLLAAVENTERKETSWVSGKQLHARLSPDRRLVLHKPYDGDAFLLADAVTGKTKVRLLHDRERWSWGTYFAAFSPDGSRVFTSAGGRDARVWDVKSARPIMVLNEIPGQATLGVFSPDGKRLLVVVGKIAYLWDLQTRRHLATLEGHEGGIVQAAFSPDGKRILTGGHDQTLLWDAGTGQTLDWFDGHSGTVTHVAFSPDGRLVATGGEDGTVRIWPADRVSAARQRLPRLLTAAERERYAVGTAKPAPRLPTVMPPPGETASALLSGPRKLSADDEAAANKRLAQLRKGGTAAREELIALRRDYPGSAQALEAAALLAKLLSPLDALDAGKIPEAERIANHPKELVALLGEQRWRHGSAVTRICVRPDGRVIASQDDHEVRLWDAKQGVARGTIAGKLLGFVRNSGNLATHSDGHVRFWDTTGAKPRQVRTIAHAEAANALSSDGTTLAGVTSSFAIRLWDLSQGKAQPQASLTGHGSNRYPRLAFSSDGRTLATWADGDVARIWDLSQTKPVEMAVLSGLRKYSNVVALSPDGRRVALTGPDGVRLWTLTGTKAIQTGVLKSLGESVHSLTFSRDGKTLASGGGHRWTEVTLWDVSGAEPKQLTALAGHSSTPLALAFAPDGSFLVTSGHDCTVRVWDLKPLPARPRFQLRGHTGPVSGVAFAPDRPLLASTGEDDTTRLWDLSNGTVREQAVLPGGSGPLSFTPDGRTLAVGNSYAPLRLWDVSGQQPRLRADLPGHSHGPMSLALSGDGLRLLSGSLSPILRLWDLGAAQPRESAVFPNGKNYIGVTSISLSPDGGTVAAGTNYNERPLRLWRLTGKGFEPVPMPKTVARHVLFSPDGKTLAVSDDNYDVYLWDLSSPIPVRRATLKGHQLQGWSGIHRSFAFSPDGSRLASTAQDRRLILWDTWTGALVRQWQLPVEPSQVAFTADGRHVATGNRDGTIYVFRVGR
jgi:WD40 repeat protein